MKNTISVGVRGATESAHEFTNAWRRSELGVSPKQPVEHLYFEDLATLLKVLTPMRLEVLKGIHELGPVSIRALAGRIKRDYKNVHRDIQLLEQVGLVSRSTEGKLIAPYTKIIAEIALAA